MSKLSKLLMAIASMILIGFVGKAFILDEAVKGYLVTFFFVGSGLALLRLFINAMIGKMKGKHIVLKIGFFAVLLGLGIPFQSWFRTEVIFSMSKAFIVPSISNTMKALGEILTKSDTYDILFSTILRLLSSITICFI